MICYIQVMNNKLNNNKNCTSMYTTRNRMTGLPTINRLMGGFADADLGKFFGTDVYSVSPAVNILKTETGFRIDLVAPGFKKENFNISLEKNTLTVKGEHKEELEEKNEKYTRREFKFGSFERSFTLPENTNEDGIKAKYNDGILSISITRSEEPKKTKEIQVA